MQMRISEEADAELKTAYGEMLAGSVSHPDQRQWYAIWDIHLLNGERIGDLSFKGLSSEGIAEIGYGLLPEYWGKGFAAEAVKAMAEWAFHQPGVRALEAETEPGNLASQRVLAKAGFRPNGILGEEGPRFVLQRT